MRILLLAGGAREHAIADALTRSDDQPQIITICKNANPGIRSLSDEFYVENIVDEKAVLEIARKTKPDFCIIGPDDPIGMGLADSLETVGIPSVAPKKSLARLESSKGFTRNLMQKYGINYFPKFAIFTGEQLNDKTKLTSDIRRFLTDTLQGEYVVKYDALKGGKGVKLSGEHLASIDEGVSYAIECIEECGQVIIEEKLIGIEFSFLSFASGTQVVDMPAVQDHKRAFDGDTGPNTGGMGTYSCEDHSLPFLTSADVRKASEINKLMAQALLKECGEPYRGILYGGFIAVKDGIRVIEYNARFGDPEALNILPLLSSDFVNICQGILQGTLTDALVNFEHKATVCKYIVPKGYPENTLDKGQTVKLPIMIPESSRMYLGDVSVEEENETMKLGTSRTAGIVGIGETLAEAEDIVQILCEEVSGPVRYRRDIGTAKVMDEKKSFMQKLRQ